MRESEGAAGRDGTGHAASRVQTQSRRKRRHGDMGGTTGDRATTRSLALRARHDCADAQPTQVALAARGPGRVHSAVILVGCTRRRWANAMLRRGVRGLPPTRARSECGMMIGRYTCAAGCRLEPIALSMYASPRHTVRCPSIVWCACVRPGCGSACPVGEARFAYVVKRPEGTVLW